MGRAPCCSKVGLHRGPWTPKEDALLISYISTHGEGQWRSLPKKAGLLRCGKSCRLRWMNYLRPDIKRGNITPDEDDLIIRLHALLGNRWSLISGRLPGRTDNEIKNYWNTHLSKKLRSQGTDPDTHKKLLDKIADTDTNPSRSKSKTRKSTKSSGSSSAVIGANNNKSNNSSKMKKNKRTAAAAAVIPTTSKIVVSRVTATGGERSCNGNGEKVTKIHLPKPVRVTSPLMSSSLTRNNSNASFESNLTTISSCLTSSSDNVLIGGSVRSAPLMQPPPSDYSFNNDGTNDECCGVRFLIGCDDVDQEGDVGNVESYAGDVAMMGDEHGGKLEKLYDEYLQLIEVGELSVGGGGDCGGGSDNFNDEVENDSQFVDDFLAESLFI